MDAHIAVELSNLLLEVLDFLLPGVQLLFEVGPETGLLGLLLDVDAVHGLVEGDLLVDVLLLPEIFLLL